MRIVACSLFSDVTFSSPFKQVTAFCTELQCKPWEQGRLDVLQYVFHALNTCLLVECLLSCYIVTWD